MRQISASAWALLAGLALVLPVFVLELALVPKLDAAEKSPAREAPAGEAKHNVLSREEIDAGWIRLFDGDTHIGWKAIRKTNW